MSKYQCRTGSHVYDLPNTPDLSNAIAHVCFMANQSRTNTTLLIDGEKTVTIHGNQTFHREWWADELMQAYADAILARMNEEGRSIHMKGAE